MRSYVCAHPHVSASRRGFARGPLDDGLEQTGRSRHVVAVVPSFALGALMVLEGDVICLLPRIMAAHLAERGVPLQLHEVPFDLPTVEVELRWHRRLDNDPASQWLRRCVHDAVRPHIAAQATDRPQAGRRALRQRQVTVAGEPVNLTSTQRRLLRALSGCRWPGSLRDERPPSTELRHDAEFGG